MDAPLDIPLNEAPDEKSPPAEKLVFEYSRVNAYTVILGAGGIFFLLLAVAGFIRGLWTPLEIAALFAVAPLCFALVRLDCERPKERIEANGDGIRWFRRDGKTRSLLWKDVEGVRERPFLKRIELIGREGVIRVGGRTEEFQRLREWILARIDWIRLLRAPAAPDGPAPEVVLPDLILPSRFRFRGEMYGFKPLLYALFACWFFLRGDSAVIAWDRWLLVALLCIVSLMSLSRVLTAWWRVRVERNSIMLAGLFRERRLPVQEIEEVHLGSLRDDVDPFHVVRLILKDKKEIVLSSYREGSLALYRALLFAVRGPACRTL